MHVKIRKFFEFLIILSLSSSCEGFSHQGKSSIVRKKCQRHSSLHMSAASATISPIEGERSTKNSKPRWKQQLQDELDSRPFAFNTKFGAMNLFGIYYGLVSIVLGFVWYAATMSYVLFSKLTRGRIDKNRRIPIFLAHIWGTLLMKFTGLTPTVENREVLEPLLKSKRAAMFVANHRSWMDIPFLGYAIGWRNYKMVAKQELQKVPILGRCMTASGHVILSRESRRSQLITLKSGIDWLKRGVHLCTFPEGTRSRSGKLLPFKNGAFKMAYKAGAPVVPISIVGSGDVMGAGWMMPMCPSKGLCKVVVHEPIECEGKSEEEVSQAVRDAISAGLPKNE